MLHSPGSLISGDSVTSLCGSSSPFLTKLLAGGTAGGISICLANPVDVVKVCMYVWYVCVYVIARALPHWKCTWTGSHAIQHHQDDVEYVGRFERPHNGRRLEGSISRRDTQRAARNYCQCRGAWVVRSRERNDRAFGMPGGR